MSDDLTFEQLHAQVRDAVLNDPRPPKGVRLGEKQLNLVLDAQRAATGTVDVGPVTELAGVPILRSTSADKLAVEYDGDAEETQPSGG